MIQCTRYDVLVYINFMTFTFDDKCTIIEGIKVPYVTDVRSWAARVVRRQWRRSTRHTRGDA